MLLIVGIKYLTIMNITGIFYLRTKFGFDTTTSLSPTAVVSPPKTLDSQDHESNNKDDLYYIVPPSVPSHRTRGGTP